MRILGRATAWLLMVLTIAILADCSTAAAQSGDEQAACQTSSSRGHRQYTRRMPGHEGRRCWIASAEKRSSGRSRARASRRDLARARAQAPETTAVAPPAPQADAPATVTERLSPAFGLKLGAYVLEDMGTIDRALAAGGLDAIVGYFLLVERRQQ